MAPTAAFAGSNLRSDIQRLERETNVTIGVSAYGVKSHRRCEYRSTDLFPMCSLFKVLAVAALLGSNAYDGDYWGRGIHFSPDDIVENSPITSATTTWVMTPTELADAALRFSDNTAGNLLLRELGGPSQVTAFARSVGAFETRLDRWEPALNEATPGDRRDTSTPHDIAMLYRSILVDAKVGVLAQARLREWMLRNTSSNERIRAGIDGPFELADKTGAGHYGVVNDAGILWRSAHQPVILAILTRSETQLAANNNAVVAQTARLVLQDFDR